MTRINTDYSRLEQKIRVTAMAEVLSVFICVNPHPQGVGHGCAAAKAATTMLWLIVFFSMELPREPIEHNRVERLRNNFKGMLQ